MCKRLKLFKEAVIILLEEYNPEFPRSFLMRICAFLETKGVKLFQENGWRAREEEYSFWLGEMARILTSLGQIVVLPLSRVGGDNPKRGNLLSGARANQAFHENRLGSDF